MPVNYIIFIFNVRVAICFIKFSHSKNLNKMKKIYLSILLACTNFAVLTATAQTATFTYTGAAQTYTVPAGVYTLTVDARGASGGAAYNCCTAEPKTLGGRVQCLLSVTPGEVLNIYVGGSGADWSTAATTGGWNGGGNNGTFGACGGGASDIRVGGTALSNRVIVAGAGGGGGDFSYIGGAGGGLVGAAGQGATTSDTAGGGTQTGPGAGGYALGTLGIGGNGASYSNGGGGGGYWGGNSGFTSEGGGGGGSSYTNPTLVTSVTHTQGYSGATGNGLIIFGVACNPVGSITGTLTTSVGSTTTLADPTSVPGGSWSSSNTAVATVGATTGIVTGVSAGTATITYTVSDPCGALATATVTVNAVNRISGHVLFSSAVDSSDTIKVWLITYDPSTHLLTAVDSANVFTGGTSAYYQFTTSAVTDSYRVKAAYYAVPFSSTGFVPTYYSSYYYWYDATAFYHSAPSADDGKDITMAYGTVTSGPGFIGGDVTTGANKGTSTSGPAVNLQVYLLNSSGHIMQQTFTDATGHYSFPNLTLGTYTVFPENINYMTTAYTSINLTASKDSMTSANFGMHTISKTITPSSTGVQNYSSVNSSVIAFPNPTTGKVNIQWDEATTEKGTITITDVAGQEVYSSKINLTQGTGTSQIDLSALSSGVYMISIKSGTLSYNNKLELVH